MLTIENEELGYYTLGFLHIKLNTDHSLENLNSLIQNQSKTFSTFLHEYIHFLQNFTTTSGLYSSGFYTQFIKYAIDKIKKSEEAQIKLPLQIDESFNREAIVKLNTIYLGKSGFVVERVIYNFFDYKEVGIDGSGVNSITPKEYYVNYTNIKTHQTGEYHFGIIALKEFVAHKIQNKFFNVCHPDIPYLIAELVLDKELPELCNNVDLKILLCDFALMTLHPAQFFFQTIEKLKKLENNYPKNPSQFYSFIFRDLRFNGDIGTFDNQIKLFRHLYESTKEDYINLFRSPLFQKELNWILHILKNSYALRIKNPTFMIDLINQKGKFKIDLKRIIRSLGTPFFMNNNSYGGFVPPRKLKQNPEQVHILLAASQLLNNVFSNTECSLFKFCSNNYVDNNPTNTWCKENPFKKVEEPQACSFAQLCKTWGIHDKIISR